MGIFLGVLIFAAFAICMYQLFNATKKRNKSRSVIFGVLGAAMFALFIFVPFGFQQLEAGQAAVVKVWGEAKEVKREGIHFRNILSTKYEVYDLRTQELEIFTPAYTKDTQPMEITLYLQFRVQPKNIIEISRNYGNLSDLTAKISNISNESAKVILASYTADTLIAGRQDLSTTIKTRIEQSLQGFYVDITSVALTNIDFSDAFEEIIEQKMVAEQEVLKAQNEKERAIIKAEEELEVAKKQAEAEIEKAKGQAQVEVEIAKAQAEAIKAKSIEIARMLGFEIVDDQIVTEGKTAEEIAVISEYLKYIEYLAKWDGELPGVIVGDSGQIILPIPQP